MLGMNKKNLLVKFIGKEAWYDHLYKTDLTFEPGQVREMPEHFARKFLRHIDVFQLVERESVLKQEAAGNQDSTGDTDKSESDEDAQASEGEVDTSAESDEDAQASEGEAEDDTAAILESSQARNEEEAEEDASNLLYDTLAQVNQMSQPALVEFALERYDIKIPKRTKADEARATVTNLVNEYGVL